MIESKHDINFPDVVIEVPAKLEEKTVNATIDGSIITPSEGYDGLSKVNINKIDNVRSEYIKNGIDILGVKGSLIGLIPEKVNVKSKDEDFYVYPSFGKTGITEIKVEKENLGALNIEENGTYLAKNYNVDGFKEINVNVLSNFEELIVNEDKKTYIAEENKGYNKVIVDCTYYWWYDHIIKDYPTFETYVKHIPDVFDFENIANIPYFFSNLKMETLNINFINTSTLSNIRGLIGNNSTGNNVLKVVNFINFDTSNISIIDQLFVRCSALTNMIGFENLNFAKVIDMQQMFQGCTNLKKIIFKNTPLTKVRNMTGCFERCTSLTEIDLSMFTGENTTNITYLFTGCSSLMNINLSNFDFSHITNYSNAFNNVPDNCYILCKDETNKNWIMEKFTNLINVHYVGE